MTKADQKVRGNTQKQQNQRIAREDHATANKNDQRAEDKETNKRMQRGGTKRRRGSRKGGKSSKFGKIGRSRRHKGNIKRIMKKQCMER